MQRENHFAKGLLSIAVGIRSGFERKQVSILSSYMINGLMFLVLIVLSVGVQADDTEADRQYNLNVYWTDTPPVLDGSMDDACWQEAEVASGFTLLQSGGKPPSQQTDVRMCYDGMNLYLFYTLHETDMENLRMGPPEDMRDQLNFADDVAEFFVDPGRTKSFKYQFCAAPGGARFDNCSERGRLWDPDWRVQIKLHDEAWTIEVAIPYTSLVINGQVRGAPKSGDIWGVNFCRDQARLREWSYWKPTGQSFHRPALFGTVTFQGRNDGNDLPQVAWSEPEELYYGPNTFTVNTDGSDDMTLHYSLSQNGETKIEKTISLGKTAEIPYHITEPGAWQMDVTVRQGDRIVFTGRAFSQLRPVASMLREIKTKTESARASLSGFDHPAKSDLEKQLNALLEKSADPIARADKPEKLSREDWKVLEDSIPELRDAWSTLRFDLHLTTLYPKGEADRTFAVGTAGPQERIHRKELFEGSLDEPIRIALAGRERESFQLLVIPFWNDLEDVSVHFSDLTGEGGTLPSSLYDWNVVEYVFMETYDPDNPESYQWEPDILWPGKPFPVNKGAIQPVFVNFLLPADTLPGVYNGTVTVKAAGQSVTLPVEVESFGFNIPARNTLEIDPWYGPSSSWGTFYGNNHGQGKFDLEIYENHLKVFSQYRHPCFPLDYYAMWKHITLIREKDGSWTFDFSEWKKIIELGLQYGATGFGASFGCNGGAFRPFMWGNLPVLNRATGKMEKLGPYLKDWREKQQAGEVWWDSHPFYGTFRKQFADFMYEEGVLHIHDFEMHDEPKSIPHWQGMIRHHQYLRRIAPEIKFKNYGFGPEQRMGGLDALGFADTWAPNLGNITPEMVKEIHERRTRWGEKFWFYTCGDGADKEGNRIPFITYDNSSGYLGPRMHGWIAWKLRVDGFLIFAMTQVPESNQKKPPEERWPNVPWKSGSWDRGNGYMVYPGPDHQLIPSMRLASVRDGLEDFEYFNLLHDRLRYLDPEKYPDLVNKIEAALVIDDAVIDDEYWKHWTKDPAVLEKQRRLLADLIREVEVLKDIQVQ